VAQPARHREQVGKTLALRGPKIGLTAERKGLLAKLLHDSDSDPGIVLNEHYEEDGETVFGEACRLGCEGIVSKRLGSTYRRGRSPLWLKVKNPNAPAVKREAEEDWGR
jgi:ATP-dependent DNA ligase